MATDYPTDLDTWTSKTPSVDDCCASHFNDLQDAVMALEVKVGVTDSGVDTSMEYKVHNFFDDAGTRTLYLYENTSPTGWTTISAASDVIVAIKGGSQDYNVNGGNVAGSWLQPTCTLTTPHLPTHRHSYTLYNQTTSWAYSTKGHIWHPHSLSLTYTGYTGGGQPHRHGTNTYRPYAAVGIISRYNGE